MTCRHNVTWRINLTLAATVLAGCGNKPESPSPDMAGTADSPPAVTSNEEPGSFRPGLPIEPDDFEPEGGFTRLNVEDFTPFQGGAETWREIDGVIVCSGDPKGYLHSNDTFGNFTWRAEYRFVPVEDEAKRPLSNTGFMIHIQEPHKVWPRSLEVQGRWDEMCSINSNGGAADLVIDDESAARAAARKPVGQWNAVEIVSQEGGLTATLNDQLICTSEAGELIEGLIGLQSELFEVHFRRLRIRRDD